MSANKYIVISGFYGNMNIGDESILEVMVKQIKELYPRAKILVFSNNPEETKRIYGVDSVSSWAPGTRLLSALLSKIRLSFIETILWWLGGILSPQIIKSIIRCDIFVLGGGGLLSDEIKRTLPRWLGKVYLANLLRKKVMIYAVGAINLTTPMGRFLSRNIVGKVDCITVRDEHSKKALIKAGVEEKKIFITADPAINLDPIPRTEGKEILRNEGISHTEFNIGISIPPFYFSRERWENWEPKYKKYKQIWKKTINELLRHFQIRLIFIPMQYSLDFPFIKELLKEDNLIENERIHIIRGKYMPKEMLGIYREMDIIIGIRLHSLIFSLVVNVPFVAISYSPKTRSFINQVDYNKYSIDIGDIQPKILCDLVKTVLADSEHIRKHLKKQTGEFQKKERNNIKFLTQILKGKIGRKK